MAKVLVLDDSPLVLNATKAALSGAGHEVTCVDEPTEFFGLLTKGQPDLALVDVSMPSLQGDAVVWIARAHQLHPCRIVFYSAKSESELRQLVSSSGADGFICKTPDNQKLIDQVAVFLGRAVPTPGAAPG